MTLPDIVKTRLYNQQIACSSVSTAQELVGHMGALQAQDYQMVKWAIGVRLPASTKETIEQAISDGSIIRTHLLRPTWHLVAAKDLRWMLELTVPRINVAMRHRHNHLLLTQKLIAKSNNTIAAALAQNKYLRREELVAELEKAGFENKDNMASHLLLRAELDGLICSGPSRGKDYTYALLADRVPESKSLNKKEALARLARTYFNSHGPATLEDFVWWSGLTKTSARKAMKIIEPDFNTEEIDGKAYWFSDPIADTAGKDKVFLLPAYDEYIISYKNRNMIIPDNENRKKAILNNGIFRPTIVHNGRVIGIWKGSVKKDTLTVELDFFDPPPKKIKSRVEIAAGRFAAFLGKELEITLI